MTAVDSYTPDSGTTMLRVEHYDLTLDYRIAPNRLAGHARLRVRLLEDSSAFELDLAGLQVSKAIVDGTRARWRQRGRKLIVLPRRTYQRGTVSTVEISYAGNPQPAMGMWGDVGWEELTDGVLVAGQPNGAATWFPCNDHPSNKADFRISVLVESPYAVISNGRLVSTSRKAGRTLWVWESQAPLAPYLATVQIGQYETTELAPAQRPGPVPMSIACSRGLRERAQRALGKQHDMMRIFTDWFGPYPFEHYGVVITDDVLEIPLESQPLSILGPNHLAATWEAERLVAHEMAHQWFGNSLTLTHWSDIWLNEGFACYAEWLWAQAAGRGRTDELAQIHWDLLDSQRQDLVLADPGPADMFDDRIYKRGALTLHALRLHIGDEWFRRLLRGWTQRYRHGYVTTADFLALAVEVTGSSVAPIVDPWLYEEKLPQLPN